MHCVYFCLQLEHVKFSGIMHSDESDISDESDLSDFELLEFILYERRPYTIRPRPNFFDILDDDDFHIRFRLTKETAMLVLSLIENRIESPTDRNNSIAPITKLLLTLRFYSLGSMLLSVADFSGVSKSSACNIVKQVSDAIAGLAPRFIKMPTGQNEIQQVQAKFYEKARMPRVIGAIDCTHVKIQSPGGANAEYFRNRKGYFSLNVQTISDANLKIRDIVARWPGSTHDQTIFSKSRIKHRCMAQEFGDSLIVGDSGYANTPYLITPLLRVTNRAEQLYNESLIRTRNVVERQYGVWKRRFPVISLGLRLKIRTSMAVILATAVLHNLALGRDSLPPLDPSLGFVEEETQQDMMYHEEFDDIDDPRDYTTAARDRLIRNHFAHLGT